MPFASSSCIKITSVFCLESSSCVRIKPFGIGVLAKWFLTRAIVLAQAKVIDTNTLSSAALDLIQEPTFLDVLPSPSGKPGRKFPIVTDLFIAGLSSALNNEKDGAVLRTCYGSRLFALLSF